MQQNPYQPRTGLAGGGSGMQQPNLEPFAQRPVNLFDPNFIQQNQMGSGKNFDHDQLSKDLNIVESIFGAQNSSNIPGGSAATVDLSHMSERDRRIFMRDLERKNRNQGGGQPSTSYGIAEPPPVKSTGATIFGDATVASNTRDKVWQQKMAQRQNSLATQNQSKPETTYQPLQVPSQGQGGFSQATAINHHIAPIVPIEGVLQFPSQGVNQGLSPNIAHRKFSAIGHNNVMQAPLLSQSPMRSSLTAQKLQQAKDLDMSIQYGGGQDQYNPYLQQQQQQPGQRIGLPPSGASPGQRQNVGKSAGLLDALGNNEQDIKRKLDNRAMQQQEYNKYLAQQPGHQRNKSASGRIIADVNSSLTAGGLQQIGGHQARQQEEKMKMQREYGQMLNDQMQFKQNQLSDKGLISEARKKQLSDEIFHELILQESERSRHGYQGGNLQQMVQYQQHQIQPQTNLTMQQANRSGLPPRVQSAVGANRQEEVQKMQKQNLEDPFNKNRQNSADARRSEIEKKREYAAYLQQQIAMKKQQNSAKPQLPLPEQLFDQQQSRNQYPPQSQQVDFFQAQKSGQHPGFQQFQQPKYSMNQQIDFSPHQMPVTAFYQGMMPQVPGNQLAGMPPIQNVHNSYDSYNAGPPQRISSHSPNRRNPNDQTGEQNGQQQRMRQEEYRRHLDEQMKLNEEKKRKIKEDQTRYEQINDKDMASYMLGHAKQMLPSQNAQVTGTFPAPFGNDINPPSSHMQMPQQMMQGGSNPGGNSAIRVGSDITKRQDLVDPAKIQAKLRNQEELKQQMEEAKMRKEAQKLKEKQADEELERRIQMEQKNLTKQEINEIKREGKRDVPEVKAGRQVRRDQFETSNENQGIGGNIARVKSYQEQAASQNIIEPPTMSKGDQFVKPPPIDHYQPLQLHVADNFTLQGPSQSMEPSYKNDLFGKPQDKISLLQGQSEPSFPSLLTPTGGMLPPTGFQSGPPTQYSQFGQGLLPPQPQFNQFNPPFSAPNSQQMQTQSDWAHVQQTQMSAKMFEEQQKMISMYQQALEQILQYRNQYFEQAMQMRENILKEREQLFEHEKLKQQQLFEMNQLKAVQNQLGNMFKNADQAPLNPQVTQNLNNYINKQKEQILQMSQSSSNMSKLMREAQLPYQQMQFQNPTLQERELAVVSSRVDIPRQSQDMPYSNPQQVNFSPTPDDDFDLQKQVDELAAQIAANDIDQRNRSVDYEQNQQRLSGQYPSHPQFQQENSQDMPNFGEFQRNPNFEKSLSSESKMVKVPNNNLQAKAAQVIKNSAAKNDMLVETWNEQSAKKALERAGILSPTRDLNNTPPINDFKVVTPKRIGGNLIVNPRSPLHTSSIVPQTIQELPGEEEKINTNVDGMRASGFEFQPDNRSNYDFNNRALSGTSSPPRANMVSLETREDMGKIEKLVQQQTQSAWADRRATMTGTSFYDNHRQTQKLQEQTQQEEMQKQLMRILGSTSQSINKEDPLKAMQQAYGPETDRDKNREGGYDHKTQHSSTVKVRASVDKLIKEPFRTPHEEEAYQHHAQQFPLFGAREQNPHNKVNQTSCEINIAATDQSGNIRAMMEAGQQYADYSKRTFQPSDQNDESRMTDQQPSADRQLWNRGAHASQENSLWDDPDMIPVPGLHVFSENSMIFEAHEAEERSMKSRAMPPSANSNHPYYAAHSITHTDHTIVGLQRMVPDLIATDEFTVEQIRDETTGEDKIQLSSKHSEDWHDRQHFKQHFQTYKQSEPMDFEEHAQVSQTDRGDENQMTSVKSRKEKEMEEIEEIIRKVTQTAAVTEQKEKEFFALRNQIQSHGTQQSWNKNQGTPKGPNAFKKNTMKMEGKESQKMQTAAANVAPHRLGQMQRAAEEMELQSPFVSNDQQILSDLDKIIANLERQQKNMATFGVPLTEDPAEDQLSVNQEVEEEEGLKTGRSQWTSLQQAREERAHASNVQTAENVARGKAPLDPKSKRPKSGKSIKSRNTSAKGKNAIDASPQKVGKYTMMAIQQQNSAFNASSQNTSVQNTSVQNRSRIDASPQRVGKYAMMALQQQTGTGNTSPSPQRLGKFAQMALQQSPQPPIGQDVDTISTKYGRNPSRERLEERSMLSNANESRLYQLKLDTPDLSQLNNQNQASGPILRPISGKSNSSRYNGTSKVGSQNRPPSNMAQTVNQDNEYNAAFRQAYASTQKTQGTVLNNQNNDRRNSSKIAYFSDDEDDPREPAQAQFSESGRTQQTPNNAEAEFNIDEDQDDVNF